MYPFCEVNDDLLNFTLIRVKLCEENIILEGNGSYSKEDYLTFGHAKSSESVSCEFLELLQSGKDDLVLISSKPLKDDRVCTFTIEFDPVASRKPWSKACYRPVINVQQLKQMGSMNQPSFRVFAYNAHSFSFACKF